MDNQKEIKSALDQLDFLFEDGELDFILKDNSRHSRTTALLVGILLHAQILAFDSDGRLYVSYPNTARTYASELDY